MEVFNAIKNYAVEVADQPVLIDDEVTILWRALPDLVDRICLGLVHNGMRRSKAVALLVGRSRHLPLTLLAIMRGGGVAVPIDETFGMENTLCMLDASDPKVFIYDEAHTEWAQEIKSRHEFRCVIRIDGEPLPQEVLWDTLQQTQVEGARFPILGENTVVAHNYGLDAEDGPYANLGALGDLWTAATYVNRGMKLHLGDRFLGLLPGGSGATEMTMRALHLSGTLICCRSTHPRDIYNAIEKQNVNVLVAPAYMYYEFCDWVAKLGGSLKDLRALEARGHVPANLQRQAKEVLGQELLPTWSMVETAAPALGAVPTGFGAPAAPLQAYPGFRERIIDSNGREVEEHDVGELCIASPILPQKTMNHHGEHRLALDGDGWLHTSVLARRRSSGEIVLMGSRFDVYLREGHRIYLRHVANLMETMPGVREVEPVIMDLGGGELSMLLAAVVAPDQSETLQTAAMMEYLWEHAQPNEMPDDVVVVPALPRLADGRVDRLRLKAIVREQVGDLGEGER